MIGIGAVLNILHLMHGVWILVLMQTRVCLRMCLKQTVTEYVLSVIFQLNQRRIFNTYGVQEIRFLLLKYFLNRHQHILLQSLKLAGVLIRFSIPSWLTNLSVTGLLCLFAAVTNGMVRPIWYRVTTIGFSRLPTDAILSSPCT